MKRLITFLLLTLSILGKTWEPISMKDYLHTYKGMVGIIQWKNKEQFLKVSPDIYEGYNFQLVLGEKVAHDGGYDTEITVRNDKGQSYDIKTSLIEADGSFSGLDEKIIEFAGISEVAPIIKLMEEGNEITFYYKVVYWDFEDCGDQPYQITYRVHKVTYSSKDFIKSCKLIKQRNEQYLLDTEYRERMEDYFTYYEKNKKELISKLGKEDYDYMNSPYNQYLRWKKQGKN